MIIILGPGFCGTNAITKYLMDLGYFMGRQWCRPLTKRKNKYPIYEDDELYSISRLILFDPLNLPLTKLVLHTLSLAINRRIDTYGDKWGFKIADSWKPTLLRLWIQLENVKFICGVRDRDTIVSKIAKEWEGCNMDKAIERVACYYMMIDNLKKPKLLVNQQDLLLHPEKEHQRIQEFL